MEHLRAGDLNRLVSVQERARDRDTYGAQSTSWAELKQVYASIAGVYAYTQPVMHGEASEVTHLICVRYDAIFVDPKIAAQYRIVYRGRVFEVLGVTNEDERDVRITLLAKEGVAVAS